MTDRPYSSFNFRVDLRLGESAEALCKGSFAEVDGLQISIEPKTIREGGANGRQIHLTGPASYSELTLRRGMTETLDLWDWFERIQTERNLRAEGEIVMLAADRDAVAVRYALTGCFPVSIKGAPLKAAESAVAVEELRLSYETLHRVKVGD